MSLYSAFGFNKEYTGFVLRNSITYQNGFTGTKTYGAATIQFSGSTDANYNYSGYTISGTNTVSNGQFIEPFRSGTIKDFTTPVITRTLTYGQTGVPVYCRYRLYKNGVLVQTVINGVMKNSGIVTLGCIFSGISANWGNYFSVVTEDIIYNQNVTPILGLDGLTISGITSTTAVGTFDIINPGSVGQTVTANGVCWNTTGTPTTGDTKTNLGAQSSYFQSSSSTMTGLTSNTLYYARGYATNSIGTTYTAQQTFRTL
jgi:hypothetical protein